MLSCYNNDYNNIKNFAKYVDATALSRRVSGLSGAGGGDIKLNRRLVDGRLGPSSTVGGG